jgi:hypothetical protein
LWMSRSVRGELGFRASRSIRRLLRKYTEVLLWNVLERCGGTAGRSRTGASSYRALILPHR